MNGRRVRGQRELDLLQLDIQPIRYQRVVRVRVCEFADRADVAGTYRIGRNMLLAAHVEELADPLALLLHRVIDMRVGVERAAENAEVRHLADVRVRDGLENQRLKGV